MGISVNDAAQALRVAFAGVEAGDWIDHRPAKPVTSPSACTRLTAWMPPTSSGCRSPSRAPTAWCRWTRLPPSPWARPGPDPARRRKRTITVSANAQGRSPGEITSEAKKLAEKIDFPPGFGIELAGAARDQQVVFTAMITALLSGIALMYFVLVIQFNSFTSAAGRDALAAAVAHRRGARADHDGGHAEPDEPHRGDHADGVGGQERHPAAGRHTPGRGRRHRPRGRR